MIYSAKDDYDDDEPVVKQLLEDGRSFIRCGCNFVVVCGDEQEMRWALQDHECPNAPQTLWYVHAAKALVALAVVALITWLLSQ